MTCINRGVAIAPMKTSLTLLYGLVFLAQLSCSFARSFPLSSLTPSKPCTPASATPRSRLSLSLVRSSLALSLSHSLRSFRYARLRRSNKKSGCFLQSPFLFAPIIFLFNDQLIHFLISLELFHISLSWLGFVFLPCFFVSSFEP